MAPGSARGRRAHGGGAEPDRPPDAPRKDPVMRRVTVEATVPEADPSEVFARLQDFSSYPLYTDAVREVVIEGSDESGTTSDWSVNFRGGILRWRERDTIDPVARTIDYEQVE